MDKMPLIVSSIIIIIIINYRLSILHGDENVKFLKYTNRYKRSQSFIILLIYPTVNFNAFFLFLFFYTERHRCNLQMHLLNIVHFCINIPLCVLVLFPTKIAFGLYLKFFPTILYSTKS